MVTGSKHYPISLRAVSFASGESCAETTIYEVKACLLEALLILYVPARLIGGEGLGPIILGALVGMPAYLNSYAAPALIAGLMEQGMSAGSAMAAVYSLVKKTVFALGFGVSGTVLFGVAFAALKPIG